MDDRTFDKQTAQDWISAVERSGRSFRDDHIYPELDNMIRCSSAQSILDIGCGQGICSDKINLKNCRYIGIEPSPFLLNRAIELYSSSDREFLLGNAYDIPLADQSFDAAFSIMVWHLLSNLEKAASELSRALKENGKFLIVTANPNAYDTWKSFYPDAKMEGKKLEGTMQLGEVLSRDVLYLHTLEEINTSLQKVGLIIENTTTYLKTKDSSELLISILGKRTANS